MADNVCGTGGASGYFVIGTVSAFRGCERIWHIAIIRVSARAQAGNAGANILAR